MFLMTFLESSQPKINSLDSLKSIGYGVPSCEIRMLSFKKADALSTYTTQVTTHYLIVMYPLRIHGRCLITKEFILRVWHISLGS